eukprot:TRINITY_DN10215_c0_g2_i1.p2 TRINITY_DN10215_c0_g2~~TRINITY_DN10215_c0_g2_i1.p2  ORF type:complete len:483 (-),score=13.86 TRINITY_DN10215_c0_g2_i1:172-1620(-)
MLGLSLSHQYSPLNTILLILGLQAAVIPAQTCNYYQVEEGCEVDENICESSLIVQEIAGYNSQKTNPCDYRYLMSIQIRNEGEDDCFYHTCGASLISQDIALTAAHCVYRFLNESQTSAEVEGQVFLARAPKCRHHTGEGRYPVTRLWIYPYFDKSKLLHDIAVLQFRGELNQPYISYHLRTQIKESDQLSILGWGDIDKTESQVLRPYNSTQLRLASNVNIMSTDVCESKLKSVDNQSEVIEPFMLCAQGEYIDSCIRDSGGPLIYFQGGQHILVGIISWGSGESQCLTSQNVTYPGVFTNISYYSTWITSTQELASVFRNVKVFPAIKEERQLPLEDLAEQVQRTVTSTDIDMQSSNSFAYTSSTSQQVDDQSKNESGTIQQLTASDIVDGVMVSVGIRINNNLSQSPVINEEIKRPNASILGNIRVPFNIQIVDNRNKTQTNESSNLGELQQNTSNRGIFTNLLISQSNRNGVDFAGDT